MGPPRLKVRGYSRASLALSMIGDGAPLHPLAGGFLSWTYFGKPRQGVGKGCVERRRLVDKNAVARIADFDRWTEVSIKIIGDSDGAQGPFPTDRLPSPVLSWRPTVGEEQSNPA